MEESGTGNAGKRRFGLLMPFLCAVLGLYALQPATAAPDAKRIQSLVLKKADGYFFTSASCMYSLDIGGVDPSTVTVYMNTIPEHVELLSIKKEAYIPASPAEGEGTGTHIEVSVRFSKSGDYRLFPLDVQIAGRFYTLQFENVHVYENAQRISPKLSVDVASPYVPSGTKTLSVEAGEHIIFTVYIQYAVQVASLSWTIPENSLFKEIRRYDMAGNAVHPDFSPELCPLVMFDWQPLSAGTYTLPAVEVSATAYNGALTDMEFPRYTVSVRPAPVAQADAAKSSFAAEAGAAFEPPAGLVQELAAVPLSDADLDMLAQLHRAERRRFPLAFLWGRDAVKERRAAEERFGLQPGAPSAGVPLFFMLLVAAVLCAVLAAFFAAAKKMPAAVLSAVLLAACAAGAVASGVLCVRHYALCRGGPLFPIPEKNATGLAVVRRGSRVRVLDTAGGWVYVSLLDTFGWIPAAEIVPIE